MKSSAAMLAGFILIATASASGQPPRNPIEALTRTRLTVFFDQTPAHEVFDHLQSLLGVRIVARFDGDGFMLGIDPDSPVTLEVRDEPALVVLELVLDQCGDFDPWTWQLRRGYLEVGAKARLSVPAAQVTRLYQVDDLMIEVPIFDNAPSLDVNAALAQTGSFGGGGSQGGMGGGGGGGQSGSLISPPGEEPPVVSRDERALQLVDLITASIEPDGWEVNGGTWARITHRRGTLVVRAPGFIHRQIAGAP